jgi:hypothetical protein
MSRASHNSFLKTTMGTYVRPNLEVECPLLQRVIDRGTVWIHDDPMAWDAISSVTSHGSTPTNNVFASQNLDKRQGHLYSKTIILTRSRRK